MGKYKDIFDEGEKTGVVKRITPLQLKWKEGMTVCGRFVNRELLKSTSRKMKDFYRYLMDSDEGPVTFLCSQAFDKTTGAMLEENKLYSITYVGMQPISKGRRVKVFDVFVLNEPKFEADLAADNQAFDKEE